MRGIWPGLLLLLVVTGLPATAETLTDRVRLAGIDALELQ